MIRGEVSALQVRVGVPFQVEDQHDVDVYAASVRWDGRSREVAVLSMGTRPLLGTEMLDGYRLEADFAESGPVTIQELAPGTRP